ncbi:hypothetical protein C7S16_1502 [Burkholderia thailandensis]|uniref:Uncharacterized protein n=1 Tax=Burkholderia thailandensis TaxID=57975 RepID=A0AAW9CWP5_BURTH|nr:hypothetical protein [Burkholderia thailandensis]MDW9254999.1 hypothetical protein [Burkholderia thailandensis]
MNKSAGLRRAAGIPRRCDILPRFRAPRAFRKDDPDQIALQSQPLTDTARRGPTPIRLGAGVWSGRRAATRRARCVPDRSRRRAP